jgi:hypothetical protein
VVVQWKNVFHVLWTVFCLRISLLHSDERYGGGMSSAKAALESDIWVGLLIANDFLEHSIT